jgi:hypothetical protein
MRKVTVCALALCLSYSLHSVRASAQAEYCASNPGTCVAIGQAALDLGHAALNGGDGTCWKLGGRCNGRWDNGAKDMCLKVRNKVKGFARDPSDARLEALMKVTGSKRSSCVASVLIGCRPWGQTLDAAGIGKGSYRRRCYNY